MSSGEFISYTLDYTRRISRSVVKIQSLVLSCQAVSLNTERKVWSKLHTSVSTKFSPTVKQYDDVSRSVRLLLSRETATTIEIEHRILIPLADFQGPNPDTEFFVGAMHVCRP